MKNPTLKSKGKKKLIIAVGFIILIELIYVCKVPISSVWVCKIFISFQLYRFQISDELGNHSKFYFKGLRYNENFYIAILFLVSHHVCNLLNPQKCIADICFWNVYSKIFLNLCVHFIIYSQKYFIKNVINIFRLLITKIFCLKVFAK